MNENKVLATVGGREITEMDVNRLIESLGPQRAMQFQSEEGRKRILEELISQELFYLDAIESNLHEEDSFKKELENVKSNLLKQYSVRKTLSGVALGENEAKDYYNQNIEQFKAPESVAASHILVDTEEEANDILGKINDGLAFGEAAKQYSKCPSNANQGSLGEFTRGKMVPEFENAAFELNKDEISKPVKTQFGYHIINVTDKSDASISSFDEVKGELEQHLLTMKQNEHYLNKGNELKAKYEVKIVE